MDPDFVNIRKTVREVLQKEDDLNEIVQLVGKVGLSATGASEGSSGLWRTGLSVAAAVRLAVCCCCTLPLQPCHSGMPSGAQSP